jgi:hypothetical protein
MSTSASPDHALVHHFGGQDHEQNDQRREYGRATPQSALVAVGLSVQVVWVMRVSKRCLRDVSARRTVFAIRMSF